MKRVRTHIAAACLLLLPTVLSGQDADRASSLARGYALVAADPAGAIEAFRRAQRIAASDTIALQIAYLLSRVGRMVEATEAFTELTASSIPEFRERAHSALIVLDDLRRSQRTPLWLRVSGAGFYDSRLRDGILWGTVQGGHHLTDDHSLSAVATLGVSADTRSVGGQLPVLYSDNVLLLLCGLRYVPLTGAAIDLEGGMAYDIRDQGTRSRFRGDLRAVASYGTGIFPIPVRTERVRFGGSFFADAGMSAGYYSRYENIIAYAQGRAGVRVAEFGASAVDTYVRTDLGVDTRHAFYNNIAELGGGVRFIPDHGWGLHLLLEYRRGAYVGGSRFQAADGAFYSTVRFMAVIERFF